jgi:hypothetical protein
MRFLRDSGGYRMNRRDSSRGLLDESIWWPGQGWRLRLNNTRPVRVVRKAFGPASDGLFAREWRILS